MIRTAAPLDSDIDALWSRIQSEFYDNQRAIVEGLHEKARSGPDSTSTRATDILWTLNHPDLWQLLVVPRGWTPEHYEQWFADTACAQLLRRGSHRRKRFLKSLTCGSTGRYPGD